MPLHDPRSTTLPAEFYGEIYEALDTSLVDQDALNTQDRELREGLETAEDHLAATALIKEARLRIEARREYALRRVIGRAASDIAVGTHDASLAYVASFEDPDEQVAAATRVAVYNFMIRSTWKSGSVASADSAAIASVSAAGQPSVRVHGTRDPETGGLWVRVTDPRSVEVEGLGTREEQVVERYPIVSQSVDTEGRAVVVVAGDGLAERTFTIPAGSRALRVGRHDNRDVLELFIPAGTVSLGEVDIHQEGDYIGLADVAIQLAARATGASRPSILDRLQPPRGNPRPIPVAKTQ